MKAWNLPISKNPLLTRDDLASSLDQLMEPLLGRFVSGGAGLHVGNSSAHYDERAALLEGASRLLWGLAPFAAGFADRRTGGIGTASRAALAHILEGLESGPDPASPWYWGVGGDRDQRFVEMAAMALSLLITPGTFWEPLPEAAKARLAAWLATINAVELPPTNWEFFRVLVNIALKGLGRPFDEARLAAGLAAVDALYREDGWYLDETNYDLYNPFAFHFYGLLYARLMGEEDPERAERFRNRARLFAVQYLPWFASDGSAVPFGRSLCYRFAASAFFSACAFAGEEVLPWGALKGIILRNLRWWFAHPILDHEGLLTIGYTYPNLLMAEQYNAPGSPYWALKTYLVLALPPGHPFWISTETGLPLLSDETLNKPPNILVCRAGTGAREQVYFLNAGQYPCWESVDSAAKYAKFAYSNRFGFCASHGSFDLSKTGCDSSLLFSEGDNYWRERRQSEDRYSCADYVTSTWKPWPGVKVRTWLLPCGPWHIRIHAIESARDLECVEGGFSLPDDNGFGLPAKPQVNVPEPGVLLAAFPWARGGIRDIGLWCAGLQTAAPRIAELHKPEPNLNLLFPRVLIPILRGVIEKGITILACAVFAEPLDGGREGDSNPGTAATVAGSGAWADPPVVNLDAVSGLVVIDYLRRSREILLSRGGIPNDRA
ncbi:MAG: DUF2264 domain-containing protein [Spirochaetes bacterium]|nr:DUF2264 domain-containing protein [Spirochaetota bacterium]